MYTAVIIIADAWKNTSPFAQTVRKITETPAPAGPGHIIFSTGRQLGKTALQETWLKAYMDAVTKRAPVDGSTPGRHAKTPLDAPFSAPKYKRYTRVIGFMPDGSRQEYTIANSAPDYGRITRETIGRGAVAALAITPRRDHVIMITSDSTIKSGTRWSHYDLDMMPTLVSVIRTVLGNGCKPAPATAPDTDPPAATVPSWPPKPGDRAHWNGVVPHIRPTFPKQEVVIRHVESAGDMPYYIDCENGFTWRVPLTHIRPLSYPFPDTTP
jgi:hypothetical protein